ncbi:MAG: Ig-like domain-containing protein [Thermoplasmata archaeon]
MKMNKIISLAIAFAMLAVSFAMVNNARAQVTWAEDSSTTLTLNAKFPKIYWIGFNETDYTDRMGWQVPVNTDYVFTAAFNYSFGWKNCDFIVQAWYDYADTPSSYLGPSVETRNLAFELRCYYDPASTTWPVVVIHPSGAPGEVTTIGVASPPHLEDNSNPDPNQWIYNITIPVHFGPQLRAATVDGYFTYGDAATALVTPNTWDFSVAVRDKNQTSAMSTLYGEFGIEKFVQLSVTGMPNGNAPPGGYVEITSEYSEITYSSNTYYYVAVNIPDLYLDGIPGPGNPKIDAANVGVMNRHPDALTDSAIPGPGYHNFIGPEMDLYVWGSFGMPVNSTGNGTLSAGPYDSNFRGGASYNVTELGWAVTVNAGIPEGIYTATIYVTIFDSEHPVIVSTTPAYRATGVDIAAGTYEVVFSEGMDILNTNVVTDLPVNNPLTDIIWSDATTLQITYTPLAAGTTYFVDFNGQGHTDTDGNDLVSDMKFEFTTAP